MDCDKDPFDAFCSDNVVVYDIESGDDRRDSVQDLMHEVESLKTQVKFLKKMAFLNVFESKENFREFFSGIW